MFIWGTVSITLTYVLQYAHMHINKIQCSSCAIVCVQLCLLLLWQYLRLVDNVSNTHIPSVLSFWLLYILQRVSFAHFVSTNWAQQRLTGILLVNSTPSAVQNLQFWLWNHLEVINSSFEWWRMHEFYSLNVLKQRISIRVLMISAAVLSIDEIS